MKGLSQISGLSCLYSSTSIIQPSITRISRLTKVKPCLPKYNARQA